MGKDTWFTLDEHYRAFIDDEVAAGRYRSASDVIRTALRLLEDRETRLRALGEALIEGARSGPSTPFDFDTFLPRKTCWRTGQPVSRYLLSPAAQADLDQIWRWDYTRQPRRRCRFSASCVGGLV